MFLGSTTCEITIADKYILRGVNSIEIKRSVHQVIQTAKVTLPLSVVTRNGVLLNRIKLVDTIKEGDSIKLAFGYDGKNRVEFEGYIRRISDGLPVELECEDELYRMRSIRIKQSFKTIKLKDLVQMLLGYYNEQTGKEIRLWDKVPEMELSKYQINNASIIDVLQELKDKHLMNSFLTSVDGKPTLYVGLAYNLTRPMVKYALARNTIGKGDLKYRGADDKQYKIVVVNKRRDGSIKTYEFDGTGFRQVATDTTKKKDRPETVNGDVTKLDLTGDIAESYLEQIARSSYDKLTTKGYKGSFETFLFPFSEPGTVALITDPQFPDRGGRYYVATVTTTFGISGGRRKNEIDLKVSTNG